MWIKNLDRWDGADQVDGVDEEDGVDQVDGVDHADSLNQAAGVDQALWLFNILRSCSTHTRNTLQNDREHGLLSICYLS